MTTITEKKQELKQFLTDNGIEFARAPVAGAVDKQVFAQFNKPDATADQQHTAALELITRLADLNVTAQLRHRGSEPEVYILSGENVLGTLDVSISDSYTARSAQSTTRWGGGPFEPKNAGAFRG